MGFKDDWEERKQRKEAQSYFRQNNSEYITPLMYVKMFIIEFGIAVLGGFIMVWWVSMTHVSSVFFDILIGYLVGLASQRITHTGNIKLAIVAVLAYSIGTVVGMIGYYMSSIGFMNSNLTIVWFYISIIFSSPLDCILLLAGAVFAYYVARR